MRIYKCLLIDYILLFLIVMSCSSQDDIYLKYVAEGRERYVGIIKDFKIEAGMNRFKMSWLKPTDPTVSFIKIVYSNSDSSECGQIIVPSTTNVIETDKVENPHTFLDLPYIFECYAVNNDGKESLVVECMSRPFTETHSAIISFPKGVKKYIYRNNDIFLFIDKNVNTMKSAKIKYLKDGIANEIELVNNKEDIIQIKSIDSESEVSIERIACISECIDDVVFKPYILSRKTRFLNLDFENQLKNTYSLEQITPEFISTQDTLTLNYDVSSFEDILHFTNLKTVILGGNRYLDINEDYSLNSMRLSQLEDKRKSVYALIKLKELLGNQFSLIIYNNHYEIKDEFGLEFAINLSFPRLPNISYYRTSDWTIISSTKRSNEGEDDPAKPEYLLDNDPYYVWAPDVKNDGIRTHELTITTGKNPILIRGFKVTQGVHKTKEQWVMYPEYIQNKIQIELSNDKQNWHLATVEKETTIGDNFGESTLIKLTTPQKANFIKITIIDKFDGYDGNVFLGDFMVF